MCSMLKCTMMTDVDLSAMQRGFGLLEDVLTLLMLYFTMASAAQSSCFRINDTPCSHTSWNKSSCLTMSFHFHSKYWSQQTEEHVDRNKPILQEISFDKLKFISVKRGCGRMKNRLLTTDNGIMFCARYRDNAEQLQGEIFTFVLATILKIENVLPAYSMQVTPHSKIWSSIWQKLQASGWRPHAVVILTIWIERLQPTYSPIYLFKNQNCCINTNNVMNYCVELSEAGLLLQLSDLFLLDYITGNVDRFVSHMYSLQWDKHAFHRSVHNLKQTEKGFLLFLDNESAFEHSYRLMAQYQHFHEMLLKRICLFRKSTADQIHMLSKLSITELKVLLHPTHRADNLVPVLSKKVLKIFQQRLRLASFHIHSYCIS